ncbi:MAG: hypothetical protein SGILL_003590 [Bacillariaceae sp.]
MSNIHFSKEGSPSNSQARMGVLGVAALGVVTSSVVLTSCDLLRYDEGSLGLKNYADEQTGDCTAFVELEDQALRTAQSASFGAFALGVVFLAISAAHELWVPIPFKNAILSACAMMIELSLMIVYTAKENGICEMQSCTWGSAVTYLTVTQIAFAAASIGSAYTGEELATKGAPFGMRAYFGSSKGDSIRRSQRRLELGLDLGGTEKYCDI